MNYPGQGENGRGRTLAACCARGRAHPDNFASAVTDRLQDEVPPIPFAEVRATVEQELERPFGECFTLFEEAPLGSASIAQVHRATLPGGERVVVKVCRPGLEEIVRVD